MARQWWLARLSVNWNTTFPRATDGLFQLFLRGEDTILSQSFVKVCGEQDEL
jgi:hypothetical protein